MVTAGRKSHSRALSVWANGERIATWRLPARGAPELQYDADWLTSPQARPLSLSLPLPLDGAPLRGGEVLNYFDNLLPDSDAIRRRIAQRFSTDSVDAFDLLRAIGRDCVGAVQLLGEDESPFGVRSIEGTPLDDHEIEMLLDQTAGGGLSGAHDDDDFRISLAGAQEKTALLRHGDRWLKPHGATPTTHILKLPLGLVGNRRADLTTSIENEWLCMAILRAYGLPVANCHIATFGQRRVLVVERFDRRLHAGGDWIVRLPQEDFCQVAGLPPHKKYEHDGGPGVLQLARVLQQSVDARGDIRTLVTSQILFSLLAAPDGHAKNFSIRLLAGGQYRLTPLYDVMSIWPVEGDGANQWSWHKAKLAMAIPGKSRHYAFRDIQRRHFNAMAARCGFADDAEPIIESLIERTPGAIEEVAAKLPGDFPSRVAERIFDGLRRSAAALASMSRD
ncbi:type II toxin-antitoxin system HipA family toxin [Caballeronia sp. LZ019]|uniref:type II toxin-antitoxin system HipA family toxin n=1 Tax=Caballeronia sp. LZ019 TaxID=3038555 RepID=UPI00285B7DC9|nr:type II toxin-antitoxin system HipA family toxin [Caballeronia sp. LZ019]MDR5807754.1 type II toxin-antitoxin system HipA family toxin [Caballeronia sp. LZ019]